MDIKKCTRCLHDMPHSEYVKSRYNSDDYSQYVKYARHTINEYYAAKIAIIFDTGRMVDAVFTCRANFMIT
jgi:hypothetical protein